MTEAIYDCEGRPIGEKVDGKINWYFSDGPAGGFKGGHYMDTYEFLIYNNITEGLFEHLTDPE